MSSSSLPVQSCSLNVPPLGTIGEVLSKGLGKNFKECSVAVVDCPDLTQPPWNLAAPGLGGSTRLVDVGGVPYLFPLARTDKFYDLAEVAVLAELPGAFMVGAGAGSSRVVGVNCEMMPNVTVSSHCTQGHNNTHIAKVNTKDGSAVLEKYTSTECGPLMNIFASEGKPGKVLEIRAKCRTGPDNFVTCMRKAMQSHFGEQPVAMGGAFHIVSGKAKLHVMPEFSEKPLVTDEDVNQWLHFYEVSAPLICLSEFISHDAGYDLRVEHTHCFSDHGEGGHYHYDITPDEVEYHGYYSTAERLYRIDRPTETHMIGRD